MQNSKFLKKVVLYFFIVCFTFSILLYALNYYLSPKPPNILGMHINDAIIRMENDGYTKLYSSHGEIPFKTCQHNQKIVFVLYKADAWWVNVKVNRDCTVVDSEVDWHGLAL